MPVAKLLKSSSSLILPLAKLNLDDVRRVQERRHQIENEALRAQRGMRNAVYSFDQGSMTQAESNDAWEQHRQRGAALYEELKALPEYPSIAAQRIRDEQGIIDDVTIILGWFQSQINVTNAMGDDQMQAAATDIVLSHGHLLLEELVVILRSAIRGDFGEVFNRIDVATIHRYIKKWEKNKIESATIRSESAHRAGVAPLREAEVDPLKEQLIGAARIGQLMGDASRHFSGERKALQSPSNNS